jgi:MFS family permease
MATQLLGGYLADKYGGKKVLAGGIAWFSVASLLLPAALSPAVVASGLALPAMLMARCFVVRSKICCCSRFALLCRWVGDRLQCYSLHQVPVEINCTGFGE